MTSPVAPNGTVTTVEESCASLRAAPKTGLCWVTLFVRPIKLVGAIRYDDYLAQAWTSGATSSFYEVTYEVTGKLTRPHSINVNGRVYMFLNQ